MIIIMFSKSLLIDSLLINPITSNGKFIKPRLPMTSDETFIKKFSKKKEKQKRVFYFWY